MFKLLLCAALPAAANAAVAASSSSTSSSAAASASSAASSAPPTLTISTSTPAPTIPLDNILPSQAALPPVQAWCPSKIFCAGLLLQTLNIAQPFSDSKTIVDKPTKGTSSQTLADFTAFAGNGSGNNITEGEVINFLENDFQGEGLELEALTLPGFTATPKFLSTVTDPIVKAFSSTVHGYWTTLVRGTNASTLCTGGKCESTLIPLNHTFVVPGGRFREQYYWDSFFIVQGLLTSQLPQIVNSTLQNFMDEIERFGFIPNGGRIYYLNRSQPPFFIAMLFSYVNATGDTSILKRALPIAETELTWWKTNRSVQVKGTSNATHTVFHYAVNNTAPRPESYLADYQTANGADLTTQFTDDEKAAIYAELASGAETGWDYSSRWMRQPFLGNATFDFPALRTLNVRSTIPVDLNSILYGAHLNIASLYDRVHNGGAASSHRSQAATLKAAIIDVFWEPSKLAFYDYNATALARSTQLNAAHFYPLWQGIQPPELLKNSTTAFGAFASLNFILNRYNGTFGATFVNTGQQWDSPNAWPPHQFIILGALQSLPKSVRGGSLPTPPSNGTSFDLIPSGQLGIDESAVPVQNIAGGGNVDGNVDINAANGTVLNGGNPISGEGWADALARELANRYFASVFCSWHATGGSLPGLVDRLPDDQLNVTAATGLQGQMFEKFSITDIDSAGRGGEYTVQAGFGWTNGVLLAVAQQYGAQLQAPNCPILVAENSGSSGSGGNSSSGENNGTGSESGSGSGNSAVLHAGHTAPWYFYAGVALIGALAAL